MTEEENLGEKIVQVDIENQMKTAYIDYSMSVIVSRADEIGKSVEIVVEPCLVENDFLVRLDEIIFEIVEVVDDGLSVETC